MATVHRARPSMGLQHELYRRSHRVPPPGEVHPEMLLDTLSMECQRRKHETSLSLDDDDQLDIDSLVNEFKIDDSISACFADTGEENRHTKGKKSKGSKSGQGRGTEKEMLFGNSETADGTMMDNKRNSKGISAAHEHRFRIPTVMRIRLKCGKKFKRQQSDVEKTPYSPIQEQPEDELKCVDEESRITSDDEPTRLSRSSVDNSMDQNAISTPREIQGISCWSSSDQDQYPSENRPVLGKYNGHVLGNASSLESRVTLDNGITSVLIPPNHSQGTELTNKNSPLTSSPGQSHSAIDALGSVEDQSMDADPENHQLQSKTQHDQLSSRVLHDQLSPPAAHDQLLARAPHDQQSTAAPHEQLSPRAPHDQLSPRLHDDSFEQEPICDNTNDRESPEHLDHISKLLCELEGDPKGTQVVLDNLLGSDVIDTWHDDTGNNILHRCAMTGNKQAVMNIATSRPHLTSEANHSGMLPVDMAVQHGQVACLQALLGVTHNMGEPTMSGDDLERWITLAIVGDQPDCLSILLEEFRRKSEERNFSVDKGGNSPGHVAAQLGRLKCLYVLYANEFDLTASNSYGLRPAHAAFDQGHHFCFRFLVQVESEIKLVEQIVGRACIIDRLEDSISKCRQQIENNIDLISQHLADWEEREQAGFRDFTAQVKEWCTEVADGNSAGGHNDLLHRLGDVERVYYCTSADRTNRLRHLLNRILVAVVELDHLQLEVQAAHESEVDPDERNVIIRSIQSSVEQSIMGDERGFESRVPGSTSRELVSSPQETHQPLILPGSSTFNFTAPSLSTPRDGDDDSVTSYASASLGERLPPDLRYEQSRCRGDNTTVVPATSRSSYNSDSRFSDDSSESDWSSSESSVTSSSRKWARFDPRGSRSRPSKMVYGMLIPEMNARHSSSSSSHIAYRQGAAIHRASRQKRRLSLWDLRELRARRSKNIRLNIPNENLSDDILREHRLQQHMKAMGLVSSVVKSDLVETITTASGEVFTEELDQRLNPNFAINLSKNDNSCRGKMVRFSSDVNANTCALPETTKTVPPVSTSHGSKQSCNSKPKVNIFGLITKLAQRTKKAKTVDSLPSTQKNSGRKASEKSVREYTRSEFVERYKPRSLTQGNSAETSPMASSQV